jgi:uncharacterized membrane protein YedE/YeeE
MSAAAGARPYGSPYLAGFGVGMVLLLAFVVMGRGLGASGGYSSVVATGVAAVAPERAAANPAYAGYLGDGAVHPLKDWVVFELLGVTLGGLLSALVAGRFRVMVERGEGITDRRRLLNALGGGALMGLGAKVARGCTSGQALTGGALLSAGSWLFILAAFGAGYAAAPLFRRQWS